MLVVALVGPASLWGQGAVVRVEENFRAEPNGEVLGRLDPGAPLSVGGRRGGWTEVTVRGFVYIPSLQVWPDSPLNLVVSAPEGENLRVEPSGRVAGRFESGALMEEVRRLPGWIEVQRTGWIWTESLEMRTAEASRTGGGLEPTAPPSEPSPTSQPVEATSEPPAGPSGGSEPSTGAASVPGVLGDVAAGTAVLAAPDGDTLARTAAPSDLSVLGREGNWARVQIEGWVWVPGTAGGAVVEGTPATGITDVAVEDLIRNPESYRGRVIGLELQFISLEAAEQVRTDFYEGEPFLLTRSIESERRFIYVAVPADRLSQVENLSPLEGIRVVGRLRAGAAALTGSPIVDLMELERIP